MSQKSIIITGASTGIGFACAEFAARNGFKVYAGYRKEADKKVLEKLGDNIVAIRLDINNQTDIESVVKLIKNNEGQLDILFNNAGIAVAGPLEYIKLDDFRFQYEINVVSQLNITQKLLPYIRKSKDPRIIFTSSISGFFSKPMVGAYAASKHALEGMVDTLRLELSPFGIKVVLIEPGVIKTPIWEKSVETNKEREVEFDEQVLKNYGPLINMAKRAALQNAKDGLDVQAVVEKFAKALESSQPKARYLVGKDAKIQKFLKCFTTDAYRDRLILKIVKKKSTLFNENQD